MHTIMFLFCVVYMIEVLFCVVLTGSILGWSAGE